MGFPCLGGPGTAWVGRDGAVYLSQVDQSQGGQIGGFRVIDRSSTMYPLSL